MRKGPDVSVAQTDDWTLQARCRGMADALFPEGKDQKRARVVCMGCPVRAVCLAEALDNRIEWGVWGGLTERERRQLLRQRPDVTSWAAVLMAAAQSAEASRANLPESVAEVMIGTTDERVNSTPLRPEGVHPTVRRSATVS